MKKRFFIFKSEITNYKEQSPRLMLWFKTVKSGKFQITNIPPTGFSIICYRHCVRISKVERKAFREQKKIGISDTPNETV